MAKVIFHIDLNAFFANAEVLKNSALEGQPVAVANLHKRSVVTTASYEARAFGVKSAMPIHEALHKCPQLVVVNGDYHWYKELSKRFFQFIKTLTPYVEPASIDECYVDVSELIKSYQRPLDLAWYIQKEVLNKVGLPCSIGIASNKFLAKMASDMRKPMGITVLRKQEIPRKLWPLPISDMVGIGKKSSALLIKNDICTIYDLADPKNEDKIIALLGKASYTAIQNARGNDSSELSYNHSVQSISQSTTLDTDITEYEEIHTVFKQLANALSKRAIKEDLSGSLITISIRYHDFSNVVRSHTMDVATNDVNIILENALLLFDRHYRGDPIRHLGIGLGSLYSKSKTITQLDIFKLPENPISVPILEELNKNVLGTKLMKASDLLKKNSKENVEH
ncbi:MAG: DNA polymerase IV [Erysipelotrichaceae bacterium]|nr:DNA polymerase IV [Erysipelotrichaceae bacterium]